MKNSSWRQKSRNHVTKHDLLNIRQYDQGSEHLFSLHVPDHFKQNIDFNNPNDPLLLQILPNQQEQLTKEGYSSDPVGDLDSAKAKGIIHKYHGRVLLISTGACAINCRYCFRREFPYSTNNASAKNWSHAIAYIQQNPELHEVILSGGDPLMLSTKVLNKLTTQLVGIKHIKTLRIHTRSPIVSPSRINKKLLNWLDDLPFKKVMVLHCNHPQELTQPIKKVLKSISNTNTLLLNQSVLLKKINDNADVLCQLSHKLFDYGVLPYYLNQLDKVSGTHHFRVSNSKAKSIHKQLLQKLPGYLTPKLVQEISGKMNKSPIF